MAPESKKRKQEKKEKTRRVKERERIQKGSSLVGRKAGKGTPFSAGVM